MRLFYDKSIPATSQALVLRSAESWRVEIHVRHDEDGSSTLLALAGGDGDRAPAKTLLQGPYHHPDQATAAKRAIVAQLKEDGFEPLVDEHPHWSLHAQRSINAVREQKALAAGDYRFDPRDVYLEW